MGWDGGDSFSTSLHIGFRLRMKIILQRKNRDSWNEFRDKMIYK